QIGNRNRRLSFVDADGTIVSVALRGGGSGQVFYDGTNIDLVLSGAGEGSTLAINGRGGDGRVTLRNVLGDGGLRSLNAKTTDLTGTFATAGNIGRASLGTVTGTFSAGGSIGALIMNGDLNAGRVLAGANLGSDGLSGGDGSAADSFSPASIGALIVKGSANAALVAAGVNPVNGVYLDADDQVLGGNASSIGSVNIKGTTDPSTRFVAGAFGRARLPQPVDPTKDPRFQAL
ncbi:MAG TPA: hypothetical protein VL371_15380, partial [Gemmataceae bacterium]|nr:hypothetical protein [Gemmataceae bacterium]